MKTTGLLLVSFFFSTVLYGQSLEGLWEITSVQVGNKAMTPTAKWTRILKDGTYQSGNGWLQNAEGSWTNDKTQKTITMSQHNGIIDEFGGFKYSFSGDEMMWVRTEEGMEVTVTLTRVKSVPMAPADKLVGVWIAENNIVAESGNGALPAYFFFRWDRIFKHRNNQGTTETGYWHMNGHKPHVTFLPHNDNHSPETWEVRFTNDELVLTGLSESNSGRNITYKRSNRIPQ